MGIDGLGGLGGKDQLNKLLGNAPNPGGFQASSGSSKDGWKVFRQYLGPKGFAKFQSILMNSIRSQMKREEAKARKAIRNMKLAEEGKPLDPS